MWLSFLKDNHKGHNGLNKGHKDFLVNPEVGKEFLKIF